MTTPGPADRYPHIGRAVAGFLLAWLGGVMAAVLGLWVLTANVPSGSGGGPSPAALLGVPVTALAGFGLVRWLGFRHVPGLLWWFAAAALVVLAGAVAVWLRSRPWGGQYWDLASLVLLTLGPGLAWAVRTDAGPGPGEPGFGKAGAAE